MSADGDERDEGLGGKLVEALKNSKGSGRRDLEVEHDGTRARARVHGSGPYGSSIDELTVVAPDRGRDAEQAGRDVERQVGRIEAEVTYLPERLRRHEVSPAHARGILRSAPGEMRNREYHEVEVRGGREVELRRYRYHPAGGGREKIPQSYGHETLERLTDDLAGALQPDEDEE